MAIEERKQTLENDSIRANQNSASGRGQMRRQQAMEGMSEETITVLEQVFDAKLTAVRSYEQKLASITDPYARKTLQNMIQEERSQLLYLADLIEIMEQSPDTGSIRLAGRQIVHSLKSNSNKNFAYGLGAALVAALLYPTVKETVRPIFAKAMQGIMDLSEQAQGLMGSVREDIEDLVAEAEFEKLKHSIDSEIAEEISALPDNTGKQ